MGTGSRRVEAADPAGSSHRMPGQNADETDLRKTKGTPHSICGCSAARRVKRACSVVGGRRRCTGANGTGWGARGSAPSIGGEGGGADLLNEDSCGLGDGERSVARQIAR